MEGVTDLSFRRTIRRLGGVGMTCTEFIASVGLSRGKSKRLMRMAAFDPDERPVSIQIYGRDPARMAEAARVLESRGATIIDINMGCPSKKVCANSGGSSLMADPDLAVTIVRAVRAAITIPLTVKMRSGFDAERRNAPELAWRCQEEGVGAVTIHWRTREDGYGGTRRVDKISETVQRLSIPVVGNGDIVDLESAVAMFAETGCAGIMVGRGAIADPFLPRRLADWVAGRPESKPEPGALRDVLLDFFETVERSFERRGSGGGLGRVKMLTRHVTRALPGGDELCQHVLRSQTHSDVRAHVLAYFDGRESRGANRPERMTPSAK